jgi:hypothetical protein
MIILDNWRTHTAYLTKLLGFIWPMIKQMKLNGTISCETLMLIPNEDGIVTLLSSYFEESPNFAYIVDSDDVQQNIWCNVNQNYGDLLDAVESKDNFKMELETKFILIKFY